MNSVSRLKAFMDLKRFESSSDGYSLALCPWARQCPTLLYVWMSCVSECIQGIDLLRRFLQSTPWQLWPHQNSTHITFLAKFKHYIGTIVWILMYFLLVPILNHQSWPSFISWSEHTEDSVMTCSWLAQTGGYCVSAQWHLEKKATVKTSRKLTI